MTPHPSKQLLYNYRKTTLESQRLKQISTRTDGQRGLNNAQYVYLYTEYNSMSTIAITKEEKKMEPELKALLA